MTELAGYVVAIWELRGMPPRNKESTFMVSLGLAITGKNLLSR
jgi:hypothetical protein